MRRCSMRKVILLILLLAFLVVNAGCIGLQGGSDIVKSEQSLGQELIDLKKAQENGAITPEEYEKLKKKLMDKYE